jgi:hypothetical protein
LRRQCAHLGTLLEGNRSLTRLHFFSSCVYIGPLIPERPLKPEQEPWKFIARPALAGKCKQAHFVCKARRNPLKQHYENNHCVYHFTSDRHADSQQPIHVVRFNDHQTGSEEDWLRDKGFLFREDLQRRDRINLVASDGR